VNDGIDILEPTTIDVAHVREVLPVEPALGNRGRSGEAVREVASVKADELAVWPLAT
jgi:hypothetical protein